MNNYHTKKSPLRLEGYDYKQPGGYFITIRFGMTDISPIQSKLNSTIQGTFNELEERYPEFEIDSWILMPDHLHFVCLLLDRSTINQTILPSKPLGFYIRQLKAKVTYVMNKESEANFRWRPDYYEHIIRNEKALHKIREYIHNNPLALELKRLEEL